MKPCAFLMVFGLLFFRTMPANAATSPENFLSELLQHDFDGDGSFRVGKAIFTDGRGDTVGDSCCSEAREVFYPTSDPMELVSKWGILNSKAVDAHQVTVSVSFAAVAEILGSRDSLPGQKLLPSEKKLPLRKIKPLDILQNKQVLYHLRLKGDQWYLVNPPLPRVGIGKFIEVLRSDIAQLEATANRELEDNDQADADRHRRWVLHREDQVKELENIVNSLPAAQ